MREAPARGRKSNIFYDANINFGFHIPRWRRKTVSPSMFVALKRTANWGQKTLTEWWLWGVGGKVKRNEWRTSAFRRMHFYFPSVTCWCKEHNFSIFLLLHIQKAFHESFSFPHTTHSTIELSWHESFFRTATHPLRRTKKPIFLPISKARDFLLLSLCAEHTNPHDVDIKRERGCD